MPLAPQQKAEYAAPPKKRSLKGDSQGRSPKKIEAEGTEPYFTGEFFIYQFVLARAAAAEKENYAKQVAELTNKIKTLWCDYKKANDSWYTAYKQKKSDIDQNGEFVNAECVEHECEMATMELCSKYPPELARDAITAADLWSV